MHSFTHPCFAIRRTFIHSFFKSITMPRTRAACSKKAVDLESSNVIPFLFLCPESELKALLPEMASAIPQERRYPSVFGGPLRSAPRGTEEGSANFWQQSSLSPSSLPCSRSSQTAAFDGRERENGRRPRLPLPSCLLLSG